MGFPSIRYISWMIHDWLSTRFASLKGSCRKNSVGCCFFQVESETSPITVGKLPEQHSFSHHTLGRGNLPGKCHSCFNLCFQIHMLKTGFHACFAGSGPHHTQYPSTEEYKWWGFGYLANASRTKVMFVGWGDAYEDYNMALEIQPQSARQTE